jgi:ferredoxin
MKVTVDTDKCIASGQCVLTAPEVFDLSTRPRRWPEDGMSLFLVDMQVREVTIRPIP